MCGIAGIISQNSSINVLQWLCKVSQLLRHRGNDDDGISVFDSNHFYCLKVEHSLNHHSSLKYLNYTSVNDISHLNFQLGLLHRRLSIIDISEYGHQPMCDETGNVWITYNGEIYNYVELRKNLESKGVTFFSNTDTEVVLKLYIHYGKEFVNQLNGMWALAIYDRRSNEIILSRDRIGVKPLYYFFSKNIFAFASEQKVFLKTQLVPFETNYNALAKYLIDNVLEDTEESIFKNILELQPGETLTLDTKTLSLSKQKYFQVTDLLSNNYEKNEKNIIERTHQIVKDSIVSHLRSDVDVAVSLSGGIDSSVIAVISSENINNLHTFSIVFPKQKNIDESFYINEVNQQVHSTAHYVTPDSESFFNDLDELLYSQDIPIWSTSTYNQFVLMKEVRKQGIKVILSGQGSDELFAGYQHHYVAYWLSLLKKIKWLELSKHIRQSKNYLSNPLWLLIKSQLKKFYSPYRQTILNYLSKDILQHYQNNNTHFISNNLNTELLQDLSYRRLKAFLKCEDRCSMWSSVESRLPFSDDIHLLQWAFQIPDDMKLKNGINKYVLREAFKKELPASIYQRKDKRAFDAPLKEWMVLQQDIILNNIKEYKEILNTSNINKINNIESLNKNEVEILFKLFLLSRWKKLW